MVGSKNMMIFEEIEIHLSSPQERLNASGSKRYSFRWCSHVQLIMLFYWLLLCGNQRIWSKTRASILQACFLACLLAGLCLGSAKDFLLSFMGYINMWGMLCTFADYGRRNIHAISRALCTPKNRPSAFHQVLFVGPTAGLMLSSMAIHAVCRDDRLLQRITLETDQKRHPQDASLPVVDGAVSPINGCINGYHP